MIIINIISIMITRHTQKKVMIILIVTIYSVILEIEIEKKFKQLDLGKTYQKKKNKYNQKI